jgi:hypothetical protein
MSGGFQEQQRTYNPTVPTPNSGYLQSLTPNSLYSQPLQQNSSLSSLPNSYNPQQYSGYITPLYNQQSTYTNPISTSDTQLSPSLRSPSPYYPQQLVTNFVPPLPQQQQQYGGYPDQTQLPPHTQTQQPHQTSMMGGNIMNKMSSKFSGLQKGLMPSITHTNPHANHASNTTDWKKWGKRAAIGIAGVGALTLGIDAASGLCDGAGAAGAADFSGGGDDFSGGGDDATGVGDAQTAIDANAAQHAIEAQGQQNSSMLLDPVGTTCKSSSRLLTYWLPWTVGRCGVFEYWSMS